MQITNKDNFFSLFNINKINQSPKPDEIRITKTKVEE